MTNTTPTPGGKQPSAATPSARAVREHYTKVCHCQWNDDDTEVEFTSDNCSLHGSVPDPLDALAALLAALEKRAILMDSALDAVTGDLYLRDTGQQSTRQALVSIRETLERLHADLTAHEIPSLYDLGVRPEVLDA